MFSLCRAGVGSWIQPSVSLVVWTLSETEGGLFHLWRETEQTSQSKVNTMLFPPFSFCRTANLCYICKACSTKQKLTCKKEGWMHPIVREVFWYRLMHTLYNQDLTLCSHIVITTYVNVCVCLFTSHTGTHRGCYYPTEELCRWRCLHSSLLQKVRFLCLFMLKFYYTFEGWYNSIIAKRWYNSNICSLY